jgi:hypothetical protein
VINERRLQANRANARRSTGPTSASGKARAAQNARQHGLSQDILADPALCQDVEELAQRIAQEANRPDLIDLARRVAQAEIDVQRIRQFRHERLQAAMAGLADGQGGAPPQVCSADELALALAPLTTELKTIDRYTRRALSRRKFAVRDFAAAQRRDAGGLKAWAATPARPRRRRPWRPKSPRALGDVQRFMEEVERECTAVFEDWEAARARTAARRWAASLPGDDEDLTQKCGAEGRNLARWLIRVENVTPGEKHHTVGDLR